MFRVPGREERPQHRLQPPLTAAIRLLPELGEHSLDPSHGAGRWMWQNLVPGCGLAAPVFFWGFLAEPGFPQQRWSKTLQKRQEMSPVAAYLTPS